MNDVWRVSGIVNNLLFYATRLPNGCDGDAHGSWCFLLLINKAFTHSSYFPICISHRFYLSTPFPLYIELSALTLTAYTRQTHRPIDYTFLSFRITSLFFGCSLLRRINSMWGVIDCGRWFETFLSSNESTYKQPSNCPENIH